MDNATPDTLKDSEEFAGKNLLELYDLLEPVPEPAPISMLPQTMGWLLILIILLALAAWLSYKGVKKYIDNAYRRAALEAVRKADNDNALLAEILRRTALSGYSREQVASLHGDAWLDFLDKATATKQFTADPGSIVSTAPYRKEEDKPLTPIVQNWIKHHKTTGKSASD